MQAVRAGIRALRSSSSSARCLNGASPATFMTGKGGGFKLGFVAGARFFSQSAAACSSPSAFLEKEEVTTRVLDLLKSISFVDPSKVNPMANFKDDLQLDMLENVEVMMAVEEEFALDIPDNEAYKISTTAHLIDLHCNPSTSQMRFPKLSGEVLFATLLCFLAYECGVHQ
ncbi:hypothetical protein L1049_008760 [Liquidambar formosana]|uniref:NADH-ubiquinone oxidoreductase 9.6 kDa subunit n=1 Tax=Liquidambar formosana TaxID=63359 RepID=A0AAP0X2I5_LIQFO